MRPVAWLVVAVTALPALAVAKDGEYDPCKNRGTRRLAVVYAKSSEKKECKGKVYPEKKTVCEGDTVEWSVVNTCDAAQVTDIRIEGLEGVVEECSAVRRLAVGGTAAIRCQLRKLKSEVKQKYEVLGRIGRSPVVIDPELDIRRPQGQ